MKRLDRVLVEVTIADLRKWLRELHPDLPANCLIETRTPMAPDTYVAGMVYENQTVVVVTTSREIP